MADTNLDLIRGRQQVIPMTNKSGGALDEGDVVVVDETADDAFTTTNTEGKQEVVGVLAETIADDAEGRVIASGYVPVLEVDAATARGDWLKTADTDPTKATPTATPESGSFAIALSAVGGAGQVSAFIFPGGASVSALIEVQEDDVKVLDASILNFEGGGGKVVDEGGGKGTIDITPGGGAGLDEDQYGNNLVRNSPGQIVTDGAEPQWWDDVANATITDEDTAGEGIADKHERCFKVVTIADDVYGYQTLTFADEELLDAGQTVVSFGCWVYSAGAGEASIGIFGTNLGLQESAQHTGGASWEWLEIENITLNGADASIEIRLIVDTATAYFTMPMLVVNGTTQPWKPRGTRHMAFQEITHLDMNPTGDVAWSDTDCTANTDPLTVMIHARLYVREPNGTIGSYLAISHADDIIGGDSFAMLCQTQALNLFLSVNGQARCDDSQVIRYSVEEQDADNDVRAIIYLEAYEMWE